MSSTVRCQKCGHTGAPSPTVVLDLEAEIRELKAELAERSEATASPASAIEGAPTPEPTPQDARLVELWDVVRPFLLTGEWSGMRSDEQKAIVEFQELLDDLSDDYHEVMRKRSGRQAKTEETSNG